MNHATVKRAVLLAGSPSLRSRSSALLEYCRTILSASGVAVSHYTPFSFPPEALLQGRHDDEAISHLVSDVAESDCLIVATPIYKASYSGALKLILDVLPEKALAGKIVLPVATGGTLAHLLAIDYALKPVLSNLKASQLLDGVYATDSQVVWQPDGQAVLDQSLQTRLTHAIGQLTR